jgi:hypothetical protein
MKESIITLWTTLIVFFVPIQPLLIIIGSFIAMDTVLGVCKAYMTKQPVTSMKLSRLIFKMLIYQAVVLLLYPIDVFIIGSELFGYENFATKLGAFILIFIESLSIEENIKAINHGKGFKYYFEKLINSLKSAKEQINSVKKEQ